MYAMYNDLDSQNRFYRDCAAAGVADLGLAFSGDLKADFSGFTVHVFAAKGTAEASFPADMYGEMLESHSFISGAPAVFSAVKEIVFENDANTVNIPAGAMQKFTGLQEVRILNENAKAMIGKNAFAGLNVTTECTAEQTVESEAGTVTLAKGTNAPIGTKLVLQASAEDHTAAVLEAAKSNGLFGDIPENQIRIRSFDMFLTAPDGSRVDTAATVQISQKTSEYSGSMTVFPNEFAFFHLEGGTAKLMTDEFTANLSTGIMTYGFDTDGFSPYAAAYTLDVSEVSDGVFTYLADRNGNATITGYDKGFSGNALNIPGRTVIGDASYKVIGIADGALKTPPEGISITSVTFNNEDTLNVGSGAMSGLSEIQTVYFNGTGSVVFSDGTVFSGSGTASGGKAGF